MRYEVDATYTSNQYISYMMRVQTLYIYHTDSGK